MRDVHTETARPELDLSDEECDALHDLQLAIEHLYRAYGALLTCHHEVGHAMDEMDDAEAALREAGHDEWANELRDHLLPAGVVDDRWTYELVAAFRDGFLDDAALFERTVRDDLADGVDHVAERRQQVRWRERSRRDGDT